MAAFWDLYGADNVVGQHSVPLRITAHKVVELSNYTFGLFFEMFIISTLHINDNSGSKMGSNQLILPEMLKCFKFLPFNLEYKLSWKIRPYRAYFEHFFKHFEHVFLIFCDAIHIRYYTLVRRCAFCVLVARTICGFI